VRNSSKAVLLLETEQHCSAAQQKSETIYSPVFSFLIHCSFIETDVMTMSVKLITRISFKELKSKTLG
jgi:hypothetical protein